MELSPRPSSIQLHLIVVIDPNFDDVLATLPFKKPAEWEVQRGTKVLLPYARFCRLRNIAHTICSLKAPHVGQAICEYVKQNNIERIFVGTNGRGAMERHVMGSVSSFLVKTCAATVVVCRLPSSIISDDEEEEGVTDEELSSTSSPGITLTISPLCQTPCDSLPPELFSLGKD